MIPPRTNECWLPPDPRTGSLGEWVPSDVYKCEMQVRDAILRYLEKPPLRIPRWDDHGPIDQNRLVCVTCGVSKKAFCNRPIPCFAPVG